MKADYDLHIVKYIKDEHTQVGVKYLDKVESSRVIKDLFIGTDLVSA